MRVADGVSGGYASDSGETPAPRLGAVVFAFQWVSVWAWIDSAKLPFSDAI